MDEKREDLEINDTGLQGECFVSHYLGAPVIQENGLRGDGGVVDHWYKGHSLQVKTHDRLYPHPYLYYPTTDDFKADITVQCAVIECGHVRSVG